MENNNQEQRDGIISKRLFWSLFFVCVVISGAVVALFLKNRYWSANSPVDNGLFGNYGDFIGGVVGTIVAFYSAFLLVKTFQSQEAVNRNVARTNQSVIKANECAVNASKIEIFDNKFERFFSGYQKAIENYVYGQSGKEETGRKAFEKLANEFITTDFSNGNDYLKRFVMPMKQFYERDLL